jgi:hypothetical protein
MKNFLRENWFKIVLLAIIFFGITGYLKYVDESNALLSRIEYADCKGKLETLDQKGQDNNVPLDMAIFQEWNAACNSILTYR